uniref:Uncharacterized protein n=1 Tax=Arundo donax TaxID=35708 RepID=A0A0A9FAC5_ARUDO
MIKGRWLTLLISYVQVQRMYPIEEPNSAHFIAKQLMKLQRHLSNPNICSTLVSFPNLRPFARKVRLMQTLVRWMTLMFMDAAANSLAQQLSFPRRH